MHKKCLCDLRLQTNSKWFFIFFSDLFRFGLQQVNKFNCHRSFENLIIVDMVEKKIENIFKAMPIITVLNEKLELEELIVKKI